MRLVRISLPATHLAFVVELGKFVIGCQMSLLKMCQAGMFI